MSLLAYLAIAIFLAAAGAGIVGTYNHSIKAAAAAEQLANKEHEAAVGWKDKSDKLQESFDESERISQERGKRLDAAGVRLAQYESAQQRLRVSQPDAARWMDTPLPDGVRGLRRVEAGCPSADLNLPCPPLVSGPNAGAADAGRDQRPTQQNGTGGAGKAAGVQR